MTKGSSLRRGGLFACALAGLFLLPGTVLAEAPPGGWQSTHNVDHPLVGRIWSLRENREVSAKELVDSLAGANSVLLGEIHDNPDHHTLQAWAIGQLLERGGRPAVVFEMVPQDLAGTLAAFLKRSRRDPADLGKVLEWNERGWPDWTIYQPIAEVALKANLPIKAGDVARDLQRQVGRKGIKAVAPGDRERLMMDRPLDPVAEDGLLETLHAGHCGMMPKEALRPMLGVQRLRDAVMADTVLLESAEKLGSVLIAGAGHVRRDWAVPWYLTQRAPKLRVRSLAFIEAMADKPAVTDYLDAESDGVGTDRPIYDFVWFTPRATLIDHCAELRERFRKRREERQAEEKAPEKGDAVVEDTEQ
ncbi:ChaN family lipoprotein [Rhodobium gokarnense]|uniref:Iron-regulated protein n=1 Tax=Rhodobium gokarnense TaxID=364296 RepID=A0ABT3HEG4_9HYPH|nr:ChaN family lipoprotein [Rhodobium gokarnense]MCW2308719.1 putative iron-regulated protein [Rhodobium gokarnense]